MAQPVRIGFVGCGSVMRRCYMPLARQLEMRGVAQVIAVCDKHMDRAEDVRDEYGVQNLTADYRELVARDDIDLVAVTTSMVPHGEIAKAALEAGKHVLVEKPMAVTLPEAAELVEMAKTSPGLLLPAPHVILSPTFQTIWKRVHRGDIGKVLSARAFYGWAGPSWGKWFYEPGGGSLFDLGVYNVTSLTALLGPVKRVTALAGIAIPERVVDDEMTKVNAVDNAHVLMDFGEGVYAVTTTGFTIQQYKVPGIELYGSDGVIYMNGEDWDPDGYQMWQNDAGCWQVYNETDPNWPWTDGLRHLVECIQRNEKPIITPEHGYHVLEIMLKAQEAGVDGQTKTIESTFTPPSFGLDIEQQAMHLVHDAGHGS
jgi:predicted dehydrogenase